ncbi:MAG: NAD(P)-dependent oxidoreductase, partial [Pseudomonas sp.]
MRVTLESPAVANEIQRILGHQDLRQSLAGKRLLLTGGTGFFGKWLLATLAYLNRDGLAIEVIVLSRAPEAFLREYPEYAKVSWITWLKNDVQNAIEIAQGAPLDLVIHAATDTLVGGQAEPLRLYDTILSGARNVLDVAVRAGAKRVLLTGTGAQYGTLEYGVPVTEAYNGACQSLLVSSAYAEAKRAQETLAAIYAERYGLQV